jgi:hypothetical protein
MRKIFSIVVILVLAMTTVTAVSAQSPAPGGPFATAFYVQNLGGATANCTFQFFNTTGGVAYTSGTSNVATGSALYVLTTSSPQFDSLGAGTYSGVVSCDQPVAAIVNFSDANSGASHAGVTTPGTTWYAPAIYDNYYGYYGVIIAQNATSSPVDITAQIFSSASGAAVYTVTQNDVPANASYSFEFDGLAELVDNEVYSAKITADGNIAPVVTIYGTGAYNEQMYSYNPFAAGATTLYAPIIRYDYYDYNTSLSVQNLGAAATTVNVAYTGGATSTANLAPNQSVEFYSPAVAGLPSGDAAGRVAATITSTGGQPIVALVNESNLTNRAASYSGFAAGSTTAYAPVLFKAYYEYNTSVNCQNVGGAATTITLSYSPANDGPNPTGSANEVSPSVAPGASYEFYQPADADLLDGYSGAGTMTASQPIVCVVNEDQNLNPALVDLLYAYNGIAP